MTMNIIDFLDGLSQGDLDSLEAEIKQVESRLKSLKEYRALMQRAVRIKNGDSIRSQIRKYLEQNQPEKTRKISSDLRMSESHVTNTLSRNPEFERTKNGWVLKNASD